MGRWRAFETVSFVTCWQIGGRTSSCFGVSTPYEGYYNGIGERFPDF